MSDEAPSPLSRLLRDPLTHFLVAGALLFALFTAFNTSGNDPRTDKTIYVTDDALLLWTQYRNKAFSPDKAKAYLASLSPQAKAQLITEYTMEEALYRHALSLGLDANDAIIRQRLIQKMDYIAMGFVANRPAPSEAELRAYYAENKQTYLADPWVTLTHIYFAGEGAKARAEAAMAEIAQGKAAPAGDRFLYRRNYAEAGPTLIADHLGAEIAAKAFDPATPLDTWAGPLASAHGWHLVQVKKRTAATIPPLGEITPQVMSDLVRQQDADRREKASKAILDQYKVVVAP